MMRFALIAAKLMVAIVGMVYAAEFSLAWQNAQAGRGNSPLWGLDGASPEHKRQIAALANEHGVVLDERDQIDVVSDFRSHGRDAVMATMIGGVVARHSDTGTEDSGPGGSGERLIPAGGISNVFTVLCNESGKPVTFTSDEHGFRNPPGVWAASKTDVAVLGQSHVQGYCVPDGTVFVDRLRSQYPVVLNLGISGQGPLLQLAAITEYLSAQRPDVVLWVYSEGLDMGELTFEAENPVLRRYLQPAFSQQLISHQEQIDDQLREHERDEERNIRDTRARRPAASSRYSLSTSLKLANLRERLSLQYGISTGGIRALHIPDTTLALFGEVLTEARRVTAGWGGELYVVYLPSWNRYRHGARVANEERRLVSTVIDDAGIKIIDVVEEFDRQPDPLSLFLYRRFGHYGEDGHAAIASAILKSLGK